MKVLVTGKPQFHIPFTREDISLMIRLTENHYDGACRHAGRRAEDIADSGQLVRWDNYLTVYEQLINNADDSPMIVASFRELDLCLKILESVPQLPPDLIPKGDALAANLSTVLRECGAVTREWELRIDTADYRKAASEGGMYDLPDSAWQDAAKRSHL